MKEVKITYCRPCGYMKRAERVASVLKDELGVEAKLIPGKGGVFEIAVNGKVVSKRTREGFPSEEEVTKAVSASLK